MDFMRQGRGGGRAFARNRGLLAATLAVAVLLAAPASARLPPVVVGKIAASVAEPGVAAQLRDLVKTELRALRLPDSTEQRYLLDVSLDELTTSSAGQKTETTCEVSATLRDADDGALHAILRGRARAGAAGPQPGRGRVAALTGAVRSALRRVPEAVSRR